jgi:hypothetical protein
MSEKIAAAVVVVVVVVVVVGVAEVDVDVDVEKGAGGDDGVGLLFRDGCFVRFVLKMSSLLIWKMWVL